MDTYPTSAERYIQEIKNNLINTNRFFVDEKFNSKLMECIKGKEKTIYRGTVLYRARNYTEDDRFEKYRNYRNSRFAGYNNKGSFVNLENKWCPEGRMNPAGIPYLYTSYGVETCLAEVKPYADTLVSVAKIKVEEDLKIVDFSKEFGMSEREWDADFSMFIDGELSTGTRDQGGYLFSQYVAEFCKQNKYDAIAYRSSFGTNCAGKNVTIFSHQKCKAISSKLYHVKEVRVVATQLKAKNTISNE